MAPIVTGTHKRTTKRTYIYPLYGARQSSRSLVLSKQTSAVTRFLPQNACQSSFLFSQKRAIAACHCNICDCHCLLITALIRRAVPSWFEATWGEHPFKCLHVVESRALLLCLRILVFLLLSLNISNTRTTYSLSSSYCFFSLHFSNFTSLHST